jgi:hypothetical protein
MASNNTESRDAAIQSLVDLMCIPAEKRSAAASRLLQFIKLCERLNQYGPSLVDKRRAQRIAKLEEKLRKESAGLPPVWELFEKPRCEVRLKFPKIRSRDLIAEKIPSYSGKLRGRPDGFTEVRLFGVVTGLYRVQKEHGGKLLDITNKSGEASGSLPAALEILRGLVPALVPQSTYQTLYRMRRVILDELGIRPERQR